MTHSTPPQPIISKPERLTLAAVNDATSVWFVTLTIAKDGPLAVTTVCGRFATDWTAEDNDSVLEQADEEVSALFGARPPSDSQSYLIAILATRDGRVKSYTLATIDNHPRSWCILHLDDAIKAAAGYARIGHELMFE